MKRQLTYMYNEMAALIGCTEKLLSQPFAEQDLLEDNSIENYIAERENIVKRLQAIRWSPDSGKQIEAWMAQGNLDAEQEEICRLYQQVNTLTKMMAELDKQVTVNITGVRDALAEKLKEKDETRVRSAKIAGYGNAFNNTIMSGARYNRLR